MDIVKEFKNYLFEEGKSPKTIESYVGDISGFLKYLKSEGVRFNGELKRVHITRYRSYLIEGGYEIATINKKVNSLQCFNRYLLRKGSMRDIIVDMRRDRIRIASGSEHQVEIFQEVQLERMLKYIENDIDMNARDRMIFLLLMFTGVRVSELCSIRIGNIDFTSYQLKIHGKGGKVREVPLKAEIVEAIKEYQKEREKNPYRDSDRLILGQRAPLKRDAVNTLLEKYTREWNLETKLKPHTFRHTFCTRLVGKGVPLTTVSKLAGHSSVETTARFYINISKEEKMRAVNLL